MPLPRTPGLAFVAIVSCLSCGSAHAQHYVYAENGDTFSFVRSAHERFPLIQKGDELVAAHGSRLALKTAEEFAPYYVGIRNMHARSRDNIFHFGAEFVSPYALHNVFMWLTLSTGKGEASFVWGIGDLKPYRTTPIRFNLPTRSFVGDGQFQIYLFADGQEVFTSQMLPDQIETALDQMVSRRTRDLTDSNPQLFMGPVPEYPERLRGKHVSGKATVECEISTRGRVHHCVVKTATSPEFGEAAATTVEQWRFLPKMVKGQPVACSVTMPFIFPEE